MSAGVTGFSWPGSEVHPSVQLMDPFGDLLCEAHDRAPAGLHVDRGIPYVRFRFLDRLDGRPKHHPRRCAVARRFVPDSRARHAFPHCFLREHRIDEIENAFGGAADLVSASGGETIARMRIGNDAG